MSKLIIGRTVVEDEWTLVPGNASPLPSDLPNTGKIIVPLARWLANIDTLRARADTVGVWLDSHEDPADLAEDAARLPLIAVNFPAFKDGRGYSIAYLLRCRYGFAGELRAIGDVLRDQLFYMHRVGFNAFAIRADRDVGDALKSLEDFSLNYQASVWPAQPLFRQRLSAGSSPAQGAA